MWRSLLISTLLLLEAGSRALAQEEASLPAWGEGGPYLSLALSAGTPNDPQAAGMYEADLGFELGYQLGLGYAFGGLRLEGQLGYESFYLNNVNPLPGSPLTGTDSSGDLSGPVVMANLFYDFGRPGGIRPFFGGGIGFTRLKADFHGLVCTFLPPGCWDGEQIVGGSDTVMAWQGMAGFAQPLASGRGEWFLGYRYFATDALDLSVTGYGAATQEGVQSHSLTLGWRWYFGAPAGPTGP